MHTDDHHIPTPEEQALETVTIIDKLPIARPAFTFMRRLIKVAKEMVESFNNYSSAPNANANQTDTAPNGHPRGTPASDHPADIAGPSGDKDSAPDSGDNGGPPGDGTDGNGGGPGSGPGGAPGGTGSGGGGGGNGGGGGPGSGPGGAPGGTGGNGGPPGDGTDGNGGGPGSGPGGAPGGTGSGGGGGGNGGGGGSSGGNDGDEGGIGGRPIVLDLDGDGVELTSLDESSAFYDINGDGYLYNLGWAGADDGLLAYDKDGDNNITARDEISFVDYVEGARTDLEGLRYFDSNADGVLDSKDAEFAKFKVWQDADQDGEADAGELRSLTDAGIESIDLGYAPG